MAETTEEEKYKRKASMLKRALAAADIMDAEGKEKTPKKDNTSLNEKRQRH
jgi:hypothetical protein